MLSRFLTLFALLLFALPLPAAAPLLRDPGLYDYVGDLDGKTVIGLTLHQRAADKVSGSYFYQKYLKDIPLSGEFTGDRDLVLRESDAPGNAVGTFKLHFAETDPRHKVGDGKEPLTVDVLTGTWTSADKSKSYPVYLALSSIVGGSEGKRYAVAGATDDALVEQNVQAFCAAVLTGDRKKVAGLIHYPVAFFVKGKRTTARSDEAFLAHYDEIFTPAFVERIRAATPHNMFANDRGIMIGRGDVWFDDKGRARAMNN